MEVYANINWLFNIKTTGVLEMANLQFFIEILQVYSLANYERTYELSE